MAFLYNHPKPLKLRMLTIHNNIHLLFHNKTFRTFWFFNLFFRLVLMQIVQNKFLNIIKLTTQKILRNYFWLYFFVTLNSCESTKQTRNRSSKIKSNSGDKIRWKLYRRNEVWCFVQFVWFIVVRGSRAKEVASGYVGVNRDLIGPTNEISFHVVL